MLDLAVVLLPFGLLEILLVIFAAIVGTALVISFGHPGLDNFRSKCPACSAEALQRIDTETEFRRHRHRVFRCARCGVAFREAYDGSLVAMP